MTEQKNSVVAATENKNINIPNYHYILKTMKAIDDFDKKYQFIKGFYFLNKDDFSKSDRTKVKVMMDLAKMQLDQHKGVKSNERTN
ncbi:hypothetical protein [Ligilactobacillus salivarius]|uniref:hypothetical protein n=1 Tax=Ligilactobacillus salivarius TaxID=1624 RepID=UPI002B46CA9C|nr:hypothetical protein [Ligilactobacillus salivarius]